MQILEGAANQVFFFTSISSNYDAAKASLAP
jgi:hypothetical protein